MRLFLPVVGISFASVLPLLKPQAHGCILHLGEFQRSRISMKLNTVLLAFTLLMPCFGSAKKQPNIVLILADDMGDECLGTNGGADWHIERP